MQTRGWKREPPWIRGRCRGRTNHEEERVQVGWGPEEEETSHTIRSRGGGVRERHEREGTEGEKGEGRREKRGIGRDERRQGRKGANQSSTGTASGEAYRQATPRPGVESCRSDPRRHPTFYPASESLRPTHETPRSDSSTRDEPVTKQHLTPPPGQGTPHNARQAKLRRRVREQPHTVVGGAEAASAWR